MNTADVVDEDSQVLQLDALSGHVSCHRSPIHVRRVDSTAPRDHEVVRRSLIRKLLGKRRKSILFSFALQLSYS